MNSPGMMKGKCSKHFPKKHIVEIHLNDDEYLVYRRRNNGRTILNNGVYLDNRFVVPCNKYLLVKYAGHMIVEWCNQSKTIKYLFKYINKGNDTVTAKFSNKTNWWW